MYGTVLKLRESQTDDATGGIADVAAQSAMRRMPPLRSVEAPILSNLLPNRFFMSLSFR